MVFCRDYKLEPRHHRVSQVRIYALSGIGLLLSTVTCGPVTPPPSALLNVPAPIASSLNCSRASSNCSNNSPHRKSNQKATERSSIPNNSDGHFCHLFATAARKVACSVFDRKRLDGINRRFSLLQHYGNFTPTAHGPLKHKPEIGRRNIFGR